MTLRSLTLLVVGLAFFFLLDAQAARAQFPYSQPGVNPYGRPMLNPYVNLLRGGNQGLNYGGLVVPQQRFYNGFLQVNQQLAADQQQLNSFDAGGMQEFTGHSAYFMNLSHYYGIPQRRPQQGRSPTTTSNQRTPVTGATSANAPRR
jgi:hypothetical protein